MAPYISVETADELFPSIDHLADRTARMRETLGRLTDLECTNRTYDSEELARDIDSLYADWQSFHRERVRLGLPSYHDAPDLAPRLRVVRES